MRLVFLPAVHARIQRFVQAAKGIGGNLTDDAANAVVLQQLQNPSQLFFGDDPAFQIVKDVEQEQINGCLLELAKVGQIGVDLLAQLL